MKCKCEEIQKCQQDREYLMEARVIVKEIYSETDGISRNLDRLVKYSPQAYETDNITEICMAIEELDNDIEPAVNDWISIIDKQYTLLEEMEMTLKEEDDAYHRMKDLQE